MRVVDDTGSWFARRRGEVVYEGLSSNYNTMLPFSRNLDGVGPYY